ncbi:MAG: arylsulfatase, partial [Planctomycetales bacterium]|nr:arylsulfatase [Planctomycetales bacterium]
MLQIRLPLLASLLIGVGWPPTCFAAPGDATTPPNIIFILADDLGYGDLGCYGQHNLDTPRIDRMASEGLRFTQHYAGSTVCAPSRACLLTGQHTGHVHQRANGEIAFRPDPLDRCFVSSLQEAGYSTAMIGKSGLSCRTDNQRLPNEKGFDHFFGYSSHGAAHRYFPRSLWRDGLKVEYPGNRGKSGDTYSGDEFLRDTLTWLEANRDNKFFLHLSLQQPHLDLNAPKAWRDKYVGKFEETPIPPNHYRGESHPKATFAAMVAYLDDTVGQVLDKLDELGVAENTLVIFSSDNGPVNEGGWSIEHFNSNGPLRGHKRDMYEGGVRVPMIAYWPGRIEPGRTTDHVSAFWDFAPTACELAGVAAPADTDGVSYLPTLLDKGQQPPHDYLYWEFYEQGGKQAVRRGDWKAVRLDVLNKKPEAFELYNLAQDLGEENNIAN